MDFSDLKLLAVFSTVVETHSFAAAARHLKSSRSRVSEQVSQLETAIGVRLLQRSTRKLVITPEGKEVYERARQLPDILRSVDSLVTGAEPQGRVAISMNNDIAQKFFLPVLEKFQQRYPLVSLDLLLNDERSDLIADQIDLSIRIGLPKDDSLIGRIMHEESLGIYASADYLATHGTPTTLKQLEKCRWLLLPQLQLGGISMRLRSKKQTVQLQFDQYNLCNSPLIMQEMVKAGLGVGALLPCMIRHEIENNSLVRLMPTLSTEPLIFTLVYPSRAHVPRRTRAVIDFLLESRLFDDVTRYSG